LLGSEYILKIEEGEGKKSNREGEQKRFNSGEKGRVIHSLGSSKLRGDTVRRSNIPKGVRDLDESAVGREKGEI